VIEGAIVDKDCRIGNDVRIKGGSHLPDTDNKLFAVKEGVVVIKKGAILPDGFTIGL
jgi:glucose-1-phosphate adenylyltransferase